MEGKDWFLYVVDHHEGPFTAGEIQKRIEKGEAKVSSYVWKEGFADWAMMSDVPEFSSPGAQGEGHGTAMFVVGDASQQRSDLTKVSPSASVWCLNSRKAFTGPHSLKTVVRKLNDGEASVNDSIWREGWSAFVPISNLPEVMSQVDPEVLKGRKKGKALFGASSSAAALGFGAGGAAVRSYRWYRSTWFSVLALSLMLGGVYQATATGRLDLAYEKLGIKDRIAALSLPPIQFGELGARARSLADLAKPWIESQWPRIQALAAKLPEPARSWITPLQLPEGLAPNDIDNIRGVVASDARQGARVVTALAAGDELNPSFVIATNAPEGTSLTVVLRGKEGTLLDTYSYEKSVTVDVSKHLARTIRFAQDDRRALPRGEYLVIVYESDRQSPPVAEVLEALPKRSGPSAVPTGKVLFVVDSYFLGGKKDPAYATRLKEYNERIRAKVIEESTEARQLTLTLESIANESASRFFALAGGQSGPKRAEAWRQYHAKYAKISGQIGTALNKAAPGDRPGARVLQPLYEKLRQAYRFAEELHQAEADFMAAKGVSMDAVKAKAGMTAEALKELKQALSKVSDGRPTA